MTAEAIPVDAARNALIRLTSAGAVTRTIGAFIVGIGVRDDWAARAIHTLPLDDVRARLTRTRARGIAANRIDAMATETVAIGATRDALLELAGAGAIARTVGAFITRIGVYNDWTARAVRTLALDDARTCLARARARVIATNAIDAMDAEAIAVDAARNALLELASAAAIACTVHTLIVGIHVRDDWTARAIHALALDDARACLTRAHARRIATNSVNTMATETLRIDRTRSAQIEFARRTAIARAIGALVLGIRTNGDIAARSIGTAIEQRRACLTNARTSAGAANTINAIPRHAFRRGRTSLTVILFARARAVTRIDARTTRQILIVLRHIGACADAAGEVARRAHGAARRIATNTIDAIVAYAFTACGARLAIGFLARPIAITRIIAIDVARRIH